MKAYVFPDARLSSYARQVVWLAIDTEKAANAAVIEKYPVPAWPSLFVIDPQKESILLRWTGSASVEAGFASRSSVATRDRGPSGIATKPFGSTPP